MPPIRGGRYPTYHTRKRYELLDDIFIKPVSELVTAYLPCEHCGADCSITEMSKLLHKVYFDFDASGATRILDIKKDYPLGYGQKKKHHLYILALHKYKLMVHNIILKTGEVVEVKEYDFWLYKGLFDAEIIKKYDNMHSEKIITAFSAINFLLIASGSAGLRYST